LNSKEDSIICKECGWNIPEELFTKLLNGDHIYCEKCGFEIIKSDYNIPQISRQKTKQTQKGLVDLLALARKKSLEYKKKIKTKFEEFKEKRQN
jgi:protein-arginine kinase activator protein McsA